MILLVNLSGPPGGVIRQGDKGLQSYEISPYRDSEDEDSDEEEKRSQKPIPQWARCVHYFLTTEHLIVLNLYGAHGLEDCLKTHCDLRYPSYSTSYLPTGKSIFYRNS